MRLVGNRRRAVLNAMRHTLLFTVGSVLIFHEKTTEFLEQAIKRGQEAQDEGKQLVQEMQAQRRKKKPERINALDVRINNTLKRLNVPTRIEIEELDRHITELSEHIDRLESAS
jgi:polyhydroxyalkanoate synthesis regulator phasin